MAIVFTSSFPSVRIGDLYGGCALTTGTVIVRGPHARRILHLPQFEVLRPIVVALTVPVVHALIWIEISTEHRLHHENVLKDVRVPRRRARMIGRPLSHIAIRQRATALPHGRLCATPSSLGH